MIPPQNECVFALSVILPNAGPCTPLPLRVTVIVWPTGTVVALGAGLVAVTVKGVLKWKVYWLFGLASLSLIESAGMVTV